MYMCMYMTMEGFVQAMLNEAIYVCSYVYVYVVDASVCTSCVYVHLCMLHVYIQCGRVVIQCGTVVQCKTQT